MKNFLFINKSCERRQEDAIVVRSFLLMNDWVECFTLKEANLIIFFTCAFSQSRTVDMVKEISKIRSFLKSGAELIVGGCLPATDKKGLGEVFNGKSISPADFSALNGLAGIKIKIETVRKAFDNKAVCVASRRDKLLSDRRMGIFLSAGCLRKCSYCAIRFATGTLRSKPLDIIMRKITDSFVSGYREFDLYADSLGDYGLDIGTNVGELLNRILSIKEEFSIGLYDLHPAGFIKYFDEITLLCEAEKNHYLYVPLQSGSERILGLMNRPCNVAELKEKLLKIRKVKKNFMQTSIIVGFPTETDEEFDDTLDFLKGVKFDDVYVHFYTDMPNTESSRLGGKINKNTMLGRLQRINNAAIAHNASVARHEWENIPF